jgi:uncharacterized membrane protein YphA (DoxX/SURF4 family)
MNAAPNVFYVSRRWPGAGLLLLRLTTGAVLITQSADYFAETHEVGFSGVGLALVASVVGLALLVGFLTRSVAFAAATIAFLGVLSWLPVGIGPLLTRTTAELSAVVAIAVICLGPGAHSVDARMFGGREIVILPGSPKA